MGQQQAPWSLSLLYEMGLALNARLHHGSVANGRVWYYGNAGITRWQRCIVRHTIFHFPQGCMSRHKTCLTPWLRYAGERESGPPAAGLPSILHPPDASSTREVPPSCCHAHRHSCCCISPRTSSKAAVASQQAISAQGACAKPGLRGSAHTGNSTPQRCELPSLVFRGWFFQNESVMVHHTLQPATISM